MNKGRYQGMKIRKTLCLAMALATVCCAALTSCGSNDNAESKAEKVAANVSVDVVETADKLKDGIEYKDTLNELPANKIQKLFGLAEEDYVKGKVYVGSGGATAEEIACFEAKDSDGAENIKTALENRIESQKKAFENYQPQEMDKLGDPVLVVKGNYVFMCVSDDNAKAKEIIG